jgi:hydrogenase maturation protease
MGARVIGIGRLTAGDDGVGIAVVRLLERMEPLPLGLELYCIEDPVRVVDLIQTMEPVVIVDALAGAGPAGQVLVLDGDAVNSSHGRLGVASAVRLARAVAGDSVSPQIRIVAVTIESIEFGCMELSEAVGRAAPVAAERIMSLLRDGTRRPSGND